MAKSKLSRRLKKKPYSAAAGDEKVKRNWRKAKGLFDRGEYSVSVLRCATCIELAVNFAIRREMVENRKLPLAFVDTMLKNANGLGNKYSKILLPIMIEDEQYDILKSLWTNEIAKINRERNAIAHSGEFRSNSVAKDIREKTLVALTTIMGIFGSDLSFSDE